MRWEDERYIRLYTRDTGDWLFLSFDAQALLMMLLRKVDRAGILHLGKHGKDAIAVTVGHAQSRDRIATALDQLIADGCVVIGDDKLVVPNFIEAQDVPASDAQRKRDQREREKDQALAKHDVSHAVTQRHAASRQVTPNLTVPKQDEDQKALSAPPTDVVRVFEFWKEIHGQPKAKLTPKRLRLVKARLKDGYTADELCAAVRGCALDDFSMGKNDRHKVFNDLALICRDGEHVEKFEALVPSAALVTPLPRRKTGEELEAEAKREFEATNG